jgi:phenylalanyl-tRNA synthetase alpha chain
MVGARGPVPVPLKDGTRDVTQEILDVLGEKETFHTDEQFPDIPQAEIKAALDRLASRSMIQYDTLASERQVLATIVIRTNR